MYIVTMNGAVGIYKKKQHHPVGTQKRPPGDFVFKKLNFFDLIVVLFFKICYSYNYL